MNAVEIEEAVSQLFAQPLGQFDDPQDFALAFLEAFGNKATTLKRLQTGGTNKTDLSPEQLPGLRHALLQKLNIHIATVQPGHTGAALAALRASPATTRARAKFILATDGLTLEAEDLASGDTLACDWGDVPNHFGFFLALAGISTVRAIRESSFDIRATSRLNKLYGQLIKDNPDWAAPARRADMNHFMARLIFCFFAEDTDIFNGRGLFTRTLEQMSDESNTSQVIGEIFRAMNIDPDHRAAANLRPWADQFPHVNGGLFGGNLHVPRFSRTARTYLLHIGALQWQQINPDIFGSMIQAVADENERAMLGMHYTSVPNILKVLNPLFLDDLRARLEEAGDNRQKLLNLRKRIARIRVFDPACGSGNFLVIAYKQLRQIEAEINQRRGEPGRPSDIPLKNFRGIELRHFAAEIARLALVIAQYQCDVQYLGQKEALSRVLPLKKENWIACGNALRLNWLDAFPPRGSAVRLTSDDPLQTPLKQTAIDFDAEGGEAYLCGNPPYLGSTWQNAEQKADLQAVFDGRCKSWKSLDYVAGWFMKAADYLRHAQKHQIAATAAFVATNSICQGQQVPILWPLIFGAGCHIPFAHTSFKWANLASHNAGVTVAIIGLTAQPPAPARRLYALDEQGKSAMREVGNINAYLAAGANVIVEKATRPLTEVADMLRGNIPVDGGHLLLTPTEKNQLIENHPNSAQFIRPFTNSDEFINGKPKYCLWIPEEKKNDALQIPGIAKRVNAVQQMRLASPKEKTKLDAQRPYQFSEVRSPNCHSIIVIPRVSSENRPYLPVGIVHGDTIVGDRNFALYDAPLWHLALIASRLHWVWIGAVCVRMRTDFSYSNTLGWNTFPVPALGQADRAELSACARAILLAREAHFPASIAELYAPDAMPENLRYAHQRNDETIERIYIGRLFKNDTERLEKLFALYTQMTAGAANRK